MRIITLIKAIPDLANISISKSQQKIFENSPPILNPADEYALELSLNIKDSQKAEVLILTLIPAGNEKVIHQALAMGANQAYAISDSKFFSEDPFFKAIILAEAIKKIGNFNLIIAGSGSVTGNSGQTGPRLAEFLNLPQLTQVKSTQIKENKIIAEKLIDKNTTVVQEESLPCLLTVAAGINKPRLPNALALIKAAKKEIIKLGIDDLNLEPNLKSASEIIRTYLA